MMQNGSPNQVPRGSDLASSQHDDESFMASNALEQRPQLLYTKFQRLKSTTKLARVVLINENPIPQQSTREATTRNSEARAGGSGSNPKNRVTSEIEFDETVERAPDDGQSSSRRGGGAN
jgi:hypothetical protein